MVLYSFVIMVYMIMQCFVLLVKDNINYPNISMFDKMVLVLIFFSIEYLTKLLIDCQFHIDELAYVFKETVNIKEEICVPRVFLQGKFRK